MTTPNTSGETGKRIKGEPLWLEENNWSCECTAVTFLKYHRGDKGDCAVILLTNGKRRNTTTANLKHRDR